MLYIRKNVPFLLIEINLKDATTKELVKLSEEMGLVLNLEEMRRIRNYFIKKGRNPTDVELQSLGQAWSEHCCYKSSKSILKQFIFNLKNKDVLVKGDAGVMAFDDEHAYALRIESHNHPSAIEPYGGAATGIGGILRDVLCMGAQPIALVDPLYFGPLDYPYNKLPVGVKHPKYLFGGVVAGIRDYGNRVGVPTASGVVCFDEGYIGNCIVNVGCVGIAKKSNILKNAVKNLGDLLVLVGGKTGRDGIHGVTFASAVLTKKSDEESRSAVQLGDPIMKEPLIHACLEANDRKLLVGMKDLGGGGLSCVVGEMCLAAGFGAEVELDKVPLKEKGLAPWEIWVSESQERMMLAVDPKNIDEVLHIFRFYDVPATIIGKVIKEKVVRLYFKGVKVFDMDLEFLSGGPVYCRPYRIDKTLRQLEDRTPKEPKDYNELMLKILSEPNIASKEWVIRQYDHEVRGCTILKPLQGKIRFATHGDATVMKPLEDSNRGLALCVATNPWLCNIDPYRGGKSIIDEMCRNLSSVGAIPHSLTNCLNFGNPEKPDRLGKFYECVRGIGEVALELNIAIPSGNVSFYNETEIGTVPPTATVLGVGIVRDIMKCATSDLKCVGNPLYILGETKNEMGGSRYYKMSGGYSSTVPDVNIRLLKKSLKIIISSIENRFVASCHDVSDGGLGVCLAEMCLGGNLGAEIELAFMEDLRPDISLFSESNTRWLVELKKEYENAFLKLSNEIVKHRIGRVERENLVVKKDEQELINLSVNETRKSWREPLWNLMG